MKLLPRIAVLLFILLVCYCLAENIPVIQWTLVNDVIVFNESVQLRCNIERALKFRASNVTKWQKSTKNIVYNGNSLNTHKYVQTNDETSISLFIKDFDLTDVNVPYTCVHGFHSYIKVLSLDDASSYELQPTSHSVTKHKYTEDGRTSLYVLFAAVYPLPLCTLFNVINHRHITGIDIFHKSNEVFFEALVIQKNDYEFSNCEDELSLMCKVGRKTHDVMILRNEEEGCRPPHQTTNCKACWIMGSLSVLVNIILIIGLLLTRKLPTHYCMTSFADSPISERCGSFLDILRIQNCQRNELGSSYELEDLDAHSVNFK